ncbi:proteasome accessory factor PafA2 [Sanguibacter sp. YZGR15]|uniref:Proteasome accessory factor PafA2 n=2 Tax=Sanguibacter suaedae TaxID=2795737 RepID=A0A934I3K2_9MICO|nr:proteasome accessory factor PafA2 [Sanguibacter suaedae]
MRRVMGIETEYGVLRKGDPGANPMLMSSQVVTAYRAISSSARGRARWDYVDEDPLMDARGFHVQRAAAHPSLLTDAPAHPAPSGPSRRDDERLQEIERPTVETYDDPSAANAILTNGARLYVDHAHPEYSSPEVTTPRDLVRWDVAGERVVLAAARELSSTMGVDLQLYKNNTDGKGASYGTHENYLVERDLPFGVIVELLTAFLVTRTVFAGSGRVGLGATGAEAGFQLSQRADFMEAEVGLETTLRRPIVNTRDEPHADRTRWRRLHLIIGDANLYETSTFLKTGSTSLVLWALENLDRVPGLRAELVALRLADPVPAVQAVSRDLDLTRRLEMADGRHLTALEVQDGYVAALTRALDVLDGWDDDTREVVDRWASVLDRLVSDRASCAREVEWLGKLRVLDAMRSRDGLAWDHPRLAALDLQWSDVRPERSVYHRVVGAGAAERLVTDQQVEWAVAHPPEDTRAFFRGEAMARFGTVVSAASWDSVVFDLPGAPSLQRVPMMDPWRGTRRHVGALFDAHEDPAQFLEALLA